MHTAARLRYTVAALAVAQSALLLNAARPRSQAWAPHVGGPPWLVAAVAAAGVVTLLAGLLPSRRRLVLLGWLQVAFAVVAVGNLTVLATRRQLGTAAVVDVGELVLASALAIAAWRYARLLRSADQAVRNERATTFA